MNYSAIVIQDVTVLPGELAICWLGQAGFLLKDSGGNELVIDPYLSNYGEKARGFKRLSPEAMDPRDLKPAYYIITHLHFDHFDYETAPVVARSSPKTLFFGPGSVEKELLKMGIREDRVIRLNWGERYDDGIVEIRSVWADHGKAAPDAIGALITFGGKRLYFSGDTAFHRKLFEEAASFKPDIAFMSVNGKFGNLNAEEGARAAQIVGCQYAVPCHIWTFAEHGGDPGEFCRLLNENGLVQPRCFRFGQTCILNKDSILVEIEKRTQ